MESSTSCSPRFLDTRVDIVATWVYTRDMTTTQTIQIGTEVSYQDMANLLRTGQVSSVLTSEYGTQFEITWEDGTTEYSDLRQSGWATTQTPRVSGYVLRSPNGRKIRAATMVTFADSTEVRFTERMGKREALRQAEVQQSAVRQAIQAGRDDFHGGCP